MKKGYRYTRIALMMFTAFWLLLSIFGVSKNAASQYLMGVFPSDEAYLVTLGIVLLVLLVVGLILSKKAKVLTENSRASKLVLIGFRITIGFIIVELIIFGVAMVCMVMSGSLM